MSEREAKEAADVIVELMALNFGIAERIGSGAHPLDIAMEWERERGIYYRAIAEIQRLRALSAWRDIKDAPTDDPNFQALACHKADGGWSYYIINRHDIGGLYESWVVPPGRPVTPTHWQPFPALPGGEGESASAPTPDPAVMRDYIIKLTAYWMENPGWTALANEARGYVAALDGCGSEAQAERVATPNSPTPPQEGE